MKSTAVLEVVEVLKVSELARVFLEGCNGPSGDRRKRESFERTGCKGDNVDAINFTAFCYKLVLRKFVAWIGWETQAVLCHPFEKRNLYKW